MSRKEVVPALGLELFSCPHVDCGANSSQTWFKLFVNRYEKGKSPWLPNAEDVQKFKKAEKQSEFIDWLVKIASRQVFFEKQENTAYLDTELASVFASWCYSCSQISI